MNEFIEKLIGRLEEETIALEDNYGDLVECIPKDITIEIVNQLAEEYNNDFCEWKLDGVFLKCQHNTELSMSCLEDERYRYKHCPVCGKKIKVVEL